MKVATILRAGLLTSTIAVASAANALQTYSVSNAGSNCAGSPHGLWTNNYNASGCNEYYSFDPGSRLSVNGSQARLKADVTNSAGDKAAIDIRFGGFQETYSNTKNVGGPYDPNTDSPDWDFYTRIISGKISFTNGDTFYPLLVFQTDPATASSPAMPVLQIGLGASDKSPGPNILGASAWLDIYTASDYSGNSLPHWDLNMNLTLSEPDLPIPLPGTIALLGLGLAGLGFARRKKA